jgi:hypothetical protein
MVLLRAPSYRSCFVLALALGACTSNGGGSTSPSACCADPCGAGGPALAIVSWGCLGTPTEISVPEPCSTYAQYSNQISIQGDATGTCHVVVRFRDGTSRSVDITVTNYSETLGSCVCTFFLPVPSETALDGRGADASADSCVAADASDEHVSNE